MGFKTFCHDMIDGMNRYLKNRFLNCDHRDPIKCYCDPEDIETLDDEYGSEPDYEAIMEQIDESRAERWGYLYESR